MGIGWLNNGGDKRASNAPKGVKHPRLKAKVTVVTECAKGTVEALMPVKKSYLLVTVLNYDSPLIQGKYDLFLCPWKDSVRLFEDYTDQLETGEVARLSFQVLEMTDAEVDEWLRKNGGG